jgi:hypothetical protein
MIAEGRGWNVLGKRRRERGGVKEGREGRGGVDNVYVTKLGRG